MESRRKKLEEFKERVTKSSSFDGFLKDNLGEMRAHLDIWLKLRKDHADWVKNGKKEEIPENVVEMILEGFKILGHEDNEGTRPTFEQIQTTTGRVDELMRFDEAVCHILKPKEVLRSWERMKEISVQWKKLIKDQTGEDFENKIDFAKKMIESIENQ